ncbi:hypothetical protein CCH79_00007750 [Gambusia affinis]|uniref:ARID domain-containing protein n=1 Tax=Gambusia affinis TaxID=33528 RepID=A0A315WCK0_GAMAF|nr:hypothetical protein CCH79_00007750 [Gambusia affinis]
MAALQSPCALTEPFTEPSSSVNNSDHLYTMLTRNPSSWNPWTSRRDEDEPAYLTVGTDVSAKYRGAFCEAKIKTVKRMVKVKIRPKVLHQALVTLKGESTSQVVQDDQVKGPLRVGSTVEVKTSEGLSSEAVISKLTDASLYTVVFDDGDEKTLRRSSLCLKGERHFAESETLDQLPLTNPEHFGTPVIGKKSNRGGRRSSQAVRTQAGRGDNSHNEIRDIADEENETSSSEEEEDDKKRLTDGLLGQICSIENTEESTDWFMALAVSPSCSDELLVKKDQCLVRSFCDGKFYTVGRRHAHLVNAISITKPDFSNRRGETPFLPAVLTFSTSASRFASSSCPAGIEGAQMFLRSREVPEAWKMDMSQILDSSSSEDDKDDKESEAEEEEEENEDEKRKKHIKEEAIAKNSNKVAKLATPEEEADPEEKENFLQQLYKFMEDRGTPINKPPVLGYKDLNLFKLFRLVYHLGGCRKIESGTVWKQVYMDLGIPVLNSAASYNVKTAYKKYLSGFEEYCCSAGITFRTIHHNNPPPNHKKAKVELKEAFTTPIKSESADDKREEADSESESEKEVKERHSSPRGRRGVGCRGKLPPKPENPGRGGAENSEEQQREVRRRSNRRLDDSEKGSDDEEEDDDEEEEEGEEERRRHGSEDEEDGDSLAGTKVRVKYGRGKTQKIYEAHIKKTDIDNGEQFYLVHYYGWNVRYDEWVKADRIIWPAEKGTKKRQRKKVKGLTSVPNKDKEDAEKGERDDEKPASIMPLKPPGLKRGRPQTRPTPSGPVGRSVSKTPSSEGQANGKSSRPDATPSLANGNDTPRRRTRRTSGLYESDPPSNGKKTAALCFLLHSWPTC